MTIPSAGEPRQPSALENHPFSQPGYTDNFYDAVGGHETFVKLIDVFYDGVAADPLLRPMYPEADLGLAKRRFLMFLEQYWGGPTTYGEERGHPRLRMRHMPFRVTPKRRTGGCTTCASQWIPWTSRPCTRGRSGTTWERAALSMVNSPSGA